MEELRRRLAATAIESEAERARARAAEEAAEKAKQREVPIRPQPPSGQNIGQNSGCRGSGGEGAIGPSVLRQI